MLFSVVALSLALGLASGSSIPTRDVHVQRTPDMPLRPIPIRELQRMGGLVPIEKRSDLLEARAFENRTYNLSWQKESTPLFSAAWQGETPRIPIGPIPLLGASVGGAVNLTVQCVDCKTYGNIVASLSDGDGVSALLTFNNVGAYLDLSMFVGGQGTYTIGLGRSIGTPNVTGSVFSANFGFAMDLVLQVTGEVQATGGFQVSIPNGEKVGLALDFDFDPFQKDFVNLTANMNAAPKVNFSLLPLAVSQGSVNITAAIRLKAEAGLTGSVGVKGLPGGIGSASLTAQVGAYLNLIEVKLGTAFDLTPSATCRNSIFIDADSNAGAFARAGGAVGPKSFEAAPGVSTTFFAAGTTICLGNSPATPKFIATKAATLAVPQAVKDGACPTSPVTETVTVSSVYTLTTCAVPEMNCPARLNQVVVVTNVETVSTVRCPGATGKAAQPATGPAVSVAPVAPTGTPLNLTKLAVPRVATVPGYANITLAPNATSIAGKFLSALPPSTTTVTGGSTIPSPPSNEVKPGTGVRVGAAGPLALIASVVVGMMVL